MNTHFRRRILATRIAFAALAIAAMSWAPPAQAITGTWNADANDVWSNAARWTGGIPTSAGDIANITFNIAATRTITIDTTPRTVSTLTIGDLATTSNSFVVAASGGGTLTFDNGGSAAVLTQNATSNGDTISAPILLNSSLNVTNSSATATRILTLSAGGISAGTAGTKTITISGSAVGGVTLSGNITPGSGDVAIVKNNGNNTLILSGAANTYTGGVTLNAGTLSLNSTTALGAAASTLTITGGILAGSGITIANGNAQNWNGNFAFGGTNSLNLGDGPVTMNASRIITIGSTSDTLTVGGAISGAGFSLSTANSTGVITGILGLSGTNTYDGGTNVNGGVVRFNSAAAIPTTGTITVQTGGSLSVSGAHTTLATWLADAHLSPASTGALSLAGDSAEAFNPAANVGAGPHNTISLGANVGVTVNYTGAYTPSGSGYFIGGGGGTIQFSNTGAFVAGSALAAGNGGGGTVIVSVDNSGFNGAVTVANGTLQIGNGGAAGSLGVPVNVVDNANLAFNRSDNLIFGTQITGTGTLTKLAAGSLTLTAANTYGGATFINNGGITLGIDNALPTTTALNIGTGAIAGSLDATNFNQTVSRLSFVSTGAAANNTITIGNGKRLTVSGTGSLQVGVANSLGITTNATISGLGELKVDNASGNLDVGILNSDQNSTGNIATLNMAALASFVANVNEFRVGFDSKIGSTLTLSNTANDITATTLRLADSNANNGTTSTIILGTGTNTIKATTILIGSSKIDGILKFASQTAGSPGTVTITNKTGGAANITIGNSTTSTAAVFTALMDLRGHTASVTAGTLSIGILNQTGAGSAGGILNFDTGTFTVNIVNMANKANSGGGTATANLNISGGVFTVNSGGSFTLATQTNTGAAGGTLNITGGTLNSNVSILDGGGTSTSTITLDGGTLNLFNNTIGNGTNAINVLNFRSGTLQNVSQINNGAGLTKTAGTGTDTLILAGVNAYTGATNVNAGTLLVTGTLTGSTAVNVNSGGALGGSGGTIGTTATTVTVNAGGTLAPGASIGTLNVGTGAGNSVVSNGTDIGNLAVFSIEIDPNSNSSDRLAINGNLNLSNAFDQLSVIILGGGATATGTYTIASYTGTLTGTFDFTTGMPTGYSIDYGTGTNSAITLAVPEPGGALLAVCGSAVLLLRRRRIQARFLAGWS